MLKQDIISFLKLLQAENSTLQLELELASTTKVVPPSGGRSSASESSESLADDGDRSSDSGGGRSDSGGGGVGMKRGKRQTSLSDEVCFVSGSPSPDPQYVHLCASCTETTHLGSEFYPTMINELTCHTTDIECMHLHVGLRKYRLSNNHIKTAITDVVIKLPSPLPLPLELSNLGSFFREKNHAHPQTEILDPPLVLGCNDY